MTKKQDLPSVKMIPVDQITVLNPRERNKKVFRQIVDSISKVGLKKTHHREQRKKSEWRGEL